MSISILFEKISFEIKFNSSTFFRKSDNSFPLNNFGLRKLGIKLFTLLGNVVCNEIF